MIILNNKERLMRTILQDEELQKKGEYNPDEFMTLDDAINSTNAIVSTVARIILRTNSNSKADQKDLYNEICLKII